MVVIILSISLYLHEFTYQGTIFVNLCKLLGKVWASYVAHGFQNADVVLVQDEEDLLRRELGKVCEEHDEVEEEEQYDDNFLDEQED